MLIEICCDKFIKNGHVRPPIVFHDGLNTIVGTDNGANSIGKSTFLLIIDFALGGEDYPRKGVEVIKNIGAHAIQFAFQFGSEKYYFSRRTDTSTTISKCDSSYHSVSEIKVEEFREFLAEKYGIYQKGLTFRKAVSKFLRIAQRDNTDPTHPLDGVGHYEKHSDIVEFLERLFDKFDNLESVKIAKDDAKKASVAFKNASNYGYIEVLKKGDLEKIDAEINELKMRQSLFEDQDMLDKKSGDELRRITEIRDVLQKQRSEKSKLETRNRMLTNQLNGKIPVFNNDFEELKRYFPTANFPKLSDVEMFHKKLTGILKKGSCTFRVWDTNITENMRNFAEYCGNEVWLLGM